MPDARCSPARPIHNPMARGCHRLIREGATLVESADEVLALLGPLAADLARPCVANWHPIAGVEPILETTLPSDPDYNRLWRAGPRPNRYG